MQDRKYAAIQFTASDFALIKTTQDDLNRQLGLKMSLAKTVIYCVEQLRKEAQLENYAAAQLNKSAYEQAMNYQKYKDEYGEPDTLRQIMLRSSYEESQDFNKGDDSQ